MININNYNKRNQGDAECVSAVIRPGVLLLQLGVMQL